MSLQDELVAMRAVVTSFLLDTAANSRTGLTTPCSITPVPSTVILRLQGNSALGHVARWQCKLPDGTDVAVGDRLTVPGKGTYLVLLVEANNTLSTSTSCTSILLPTPVTATIKRNGVALFGGASVNLWPFLGTLMVPANTQETRDQFGGDQEISQAYSVFMQWPTGASGDNVVQGNDDLFVGTTKYRIVGAQAFPPSYLKLSIDIRPS